MEAMTYSAARANLSKTMDRVCENHDIVIITRQGASPVVMMSLDDYNAYDETAYLLSSKANADQLRKAIKELNAGGGQERDLIDCE